MKTKTKINFNTEAIQFQTTRSDKDFKSLVVKIKPYMAAAIRRITTDKESVFEILSISLTKVYTKIEQYDSNRSDFKNWIFRIAYNEALCFVKAQMADKKRFVYEFVKPIFSDSMDEESVNYNVEYENLIVEDPMFEEFQIRLNKETETQNQYEILLQLIYGLKPNFRNIAIDYFINGLTGPEIADKYGMLKRTQRSRIFNIRAALKSAAAEFPELKVLLETANSNETETE